MSNQKRRDLANVRIEGMQKEKTTRKWDLRSPCRSLRKHRINQELIDGGGSRRTAALAVPGINTVLGLLCCWSQPSLTGLASSFPGCPGEEGSR